VPEPKVATPNNASINHSGISAAKTASKLQISAATGRPILGHSIACPVRATILPEKNAPKDEPDQAAIAAQIERANRLNRSRLSALLQLQN
jgi:hypothetical protein